MSAAGRCVKPQSLNKWNKDHCVYRFVSVQWEHKGSANHSKELPSHRVVIFLRGPEIPFACFATCLLEKPELVRHKKPPCRLLMHHFPSLSRFLWNVPTHTSLTFLFCRVFKLPRILVKHWEDCFLFFFLILCAFEVSGCPCSPLFVFTFSFTPPPQSSTPLQLGGHKWLHPVSQRNTALLWQDQHRTAQHTPVPCLPPFPSAATSHPLAANCDSFLMTPTRALMCAGSVPLGKSHFVTISVTYLDYFHVNSGFMLHLNHN